MSVIPEDEFRKKHGWKGEYSLFRAAQASHSVKHPKAEKGCKMCEVIFRNLNRLLAEAEGIEQYVKEKRGE